jgi:hypothetical protein
MRRSILWFLAAALVWGCSKHESPPAPLAIPVPPKPMDFRVTMPTEGDYYLDWWVEDSTAVDHYRVYIYDRSLGPTLVDTTSVSDYHYNFYMPILGVIWGVSAVSVENVESEIVYGTASD